MLRFWIAGLALALVFASTTVAAAPGYTLRAVAVGGDAAVGGGGATWTPATVAVNAGGDVGFLGVLSTGPLDSGAWVDSGGTVTLRSKVPDAAPSGGTYLLLSGFPQIDASGAIAFPAVTSAGSSGLYLDTAGVESALAVSGDDAPASVGGKLALSIGTSQFFARNDAGDLAFRSGVTEGSSSEGIFLVPGAGGATRVVALLNATAPDTGGGTYSTLGSPAMNAGGTLVFDSAIANGSADHGLFVDPGTGAAPIALAGEPAPKTGGGVYDDFLLPSIGASGVVAFAAHVSGSAVTGGLFSIHGPGTHLAVAVEGGLAPGTGGGTYFSINGPPAVADDGSVAFAAFLSGGSTSGGVFVRRGLAGPVVPVATIGESVPGVASATLVEFSFVSINDDGEIAFIADLSDGRAVAVLATPSGPAAVPALPVALLPVLGLLLAATGRRRLAAR